MTRPSRSAAGSCGFLVLACWLAASSAGAQQPTIRGTLAAGIGVGAREVYVPSAEGARRLTTGPFPALDVGVRADVGLSSSFELDARLRYRTSLGISASETPPGGAARSTSARSHELDGGVMPALRFSSASDSVVLGVLLGWGARALSTVADLTLASYTVHGPLARLELRVPIAGGVVELRLAPELFAWTFASESLRDEGQLTGTGLAWGGEAGVAIVLSSALALELSYRESRGACGSQLGSSFTDAEHFGSAQLALAY